MSEKLPYIERSKHFGQGQLRIGRSLELETSIYDLAFVSQVRDEIMDAKFNIVLGELKKEENEAEEDLVDFSINRFNNASSFMK